MLADLTESSVKFWYIVPMIMRILLFCFILTVTRDLVLRDIEAMPDILYMHSILGVSEEYWLHVMNV